MNDKLVKLENGILSLCRKSFSLRRYTASEVMMNGRRRGR